MRPFLFALRGGLGILLSLGCVVGASAQAPRLPASLLSQQGELSAVQLAQITTFVDYWVQRLHPSDDAPDGLTQVTRAMKALGGDIARAPQLSPAFRTAYSRAIVSPLADVIEGRGDRAAICALYVAGRVGTDAAMALIMRQIQSGRPILRNAAARSAKLAMDDLLFRSALTGADSVRTLIRTVRTVAVAETDAVALQRQLELLDSIYTTSMALPARLPQLDILALQARITVLGARCKRLGVNVIETDALDLFIINLRTSYIALAPAVQRQRGPTLANNLVTMLTQVNDRWEVVQANPAKATALHRMVEDTENFLKLIDQTLRSQAQPPTPNTRLGDSWAGQDKGRFEQDLQEWLDLMKIDPYRGAGGG